MENLRVPDLITVPRSALQALAEWAYFPFCWDRISAKLPPRHPRWTSHNIHDDLLQSLQGERMAFLKGLFWKAEQAACRREKAMDPSRDLGASPSLELFMECVAEMDDPHWDEPLAPKDLAERKRKIKAGQAERATLEQEMEHPTPETVIGGMAMSGDIALFSIKENLASEDPETRARAQAEIPRLMAELQGLMPVVDAALAMT